MTSVLDAIVSSLRSAASGGGGDQAAPAVVLWPDGERLWEGVVFSVGKHASLLTLGPYQPADRTGPAYWIRCVLGRQVTDLELGDDVPIVYLPGVSRDEFRAAEDCPDPIKPLVELQYRGVFWSQPNGKDWTPAAFLQNRERGLGVAVTSDSETVRTLSATLETVVQQPVDWLERRQPISAVVLNGLIQPDPVSTLLSWLSDPEQVKARLTAAEWAAFRSSCRSDFEFNPEADGPIHGADLLAKRQGAWKHVWLRYREAPSRHPGVETRLRAAGAAAQQGTLAFEAEGTAFANRETWPQFNEHQEETLRRALEGLPQRPLGELSQTVLALEGEHGGRRLWVWADLGGAPLARALLHLAALASITADSAPKATVAELADWYRSTGWKADDAVLRALGEVPAIPHIAAVAAAIRALYAGWLDDTCRRFQEAVETDPAGYQSPWAVERDAGNCIVFTDGLRYDLGQRLADQLRGRGLVVDVGWHLAALPTLTPTAKPALTPVAPQFTAGLDLAPTLIETGAQLNASTLRKALVEGGYQVLEETDVGDPSKRAWTEIGDVDSQGHNLGSRLADMVERELQQVAGRVEMLLGAGWQTVEIVTDHGFLLLPGKLNKVELPAHLVAIRKGRTARLTPSEQAVDQPTVPWRWDSSVRFAVARGAACFEEGKEYEHGGLSPQECVVPHLTVRPAAVAEEVTISSVTWTGLRVRVDISGQAATIDLRTKPADPSSSLLDAPSGLKAGKASALVSKLEAEGVAAVVVVLSSDGRLLAQKHTVVGEP